MWRGGARGGGCVIGPNWESFCLKMRAFELQKLTAEVGYLKDREHQQIGEMRSTLIAGFLQRGVHVYASTCELGLATAIAYLFQICLINQFLEAVLISVSEHMLYPGIRSSFQTWYRTSRTGPSAGARDSQHRTVSSELGQTPPETFSQHHLLSLAVIEQELHLQRTWAAVVS